MAQEECLHADVIRHYAILLWDLHKAFELVQHELLADLAQEEGFPPVILRLVIQAYRWERVLVMEGLTVAGLSACPLPHAARVAFSFFRPTGAANPPLSRVLQATSTRPTSRRSVRTRSSTRRRTSTTCVSSARR